MRRRDLISLGALPMLPALPMLSRFASAQAPRTLSFPRDFGSHPDDRTEWWYITGYASDATGREFGYQVTFFRSRVEATQGMKSAFAAKHLIFAHAAVTDLRGKKLFHDQRIARSSGKNSSVDAASASEADTDVKLRDWSLVRSGESYRARVESNDFTLDLTFASTQPVLLQGVAGLSRKGPSPEQSSYYYSVPQLATTGSLKLSAKGYETSAQLNGRAWLDHEWSREFLHPDAVGWDWIGMNLDDGSSLTAFRIRRKDGSSMWDGGSFRSAAGELRIFSAGEVTFVAGRTWASSSTNTTYPVEWTVSAAGKTYRVASLLDDQELDSRNSTGSVYWEGVSNLLDASGQRVGRGYLEMTGYAQPLRI